MLNMKIEDYRIISNDQHVTVRKCIREDNGIISTKEVDGKLVESTKLVGYYSSLERALEGIQRDYVYGGGTNIQTIKEYKLAINVITEKFREQIKL
ncbi:hypothetical protein [Melissococcus plutonius]|uniref:hypothetical protein n=1 Tax=Melissococcus plutonius TaxID=33970 RepID=UPI0021E5F4DD|nr:hypothetical protein [Melissococcus plutonius]MCV2499612.1 hypothetical protein [Melissococcus plutonius]MCV2501532.1 hypothetical protein [Melissococcus plutonius]MCV2508208.1 hypothetical protein [Melissococcus plutonius]MCV2520004.1 hypothetical protein [Melissococcus plutonius]MCV2528014.1 hypothetical protein [Melissococcus plutonius]